VFTIGIALDALFPAILGHLLLVFPSGRLETRAERMIVAGIYLVATVLQVPALLFEDTGTPGNLMMVESDQDLSDLLDALQYLIAIALMIAGFIAMARRRAAIPRAQWPVLAPVAWTGGATLAAFAVAKGFDAAGREMHTGRTCDIREPHDATGHPPGSCLVASLISYTSAAGRASTRSAISRLSRSSRRSWLSVRSSVRARSMNSSVTNPSRRTSVTPLPR
jgi:hypothetical protein